MKYLLLLLSVIGMFSCNNSSPKEEPFDWLLGSWERTNDSESQQTYELWEKQGTGEYLGFGYTLQGADTIFKENIKINQKNDQWLFEVRGVNKDATLFKITDLSDNSFVAENEKNPFPKKITYQKKGTILNALVSANETSIEFNFQVKQ